MSRPEWPSPMCILPNSCISAIRKRQDFYDKDPERYERIERERQEEKELEMMREYEEYQIFIEATEKAIQQQDEEQQNNGVNNDRVDEEHT